MGFVLHWPISSSLERLNLQWTVAFCCFECESSEYLPIFAEGFCVTVSDEGERESGGEEEEEDDQGWAAWMWSMVPQILPEEEEGHPASCLIDKPPILSLAFYIHHASPTFKVRFPPPPPPIFGTQVCLSQSSC